MQQLTDFLPSQPSKSLTYWHAAGQLPNVEVQGWAAFGKLAYSSCIMKCVEAWAFGSLELWAGKLPNPSSAVAAVGVAFSVYGFLFMVYGAMSKAVCAR